MQPIIVGISFQHTGKIYHFDASHIPDVQVGDHIIVETSRGRQIGRVIVLLDNKPQVSGEKLKTVERRATPRDLLLREMWRNKENDALRACQSRAAELKLEGIKIVMAEFSFDGNRLTFVYCSESEDKANLKSLRNDMSKRFSGSQIELRQIGPRDAAKTMGGMGACGIENRCCSKFLTDFSPISIKMAKEQGISLTPGEITGMCGRLRCCLVYEFDQYSEARKELPKKGKRVVTPLGEGKVVATLPLSLEVIVALPDVGEREFHRDLLEPWDEQESLRRIKQETAERQKSKT